MSIVSSTPGSFANLSTNPVHTVLAIGDDVWMVVMKTSSTFGVYRSYDRGATFTEFTSTNLTAFGLSCYSSTLRRMVGLYKVGGKAILAKIDSGCKVFNLTDDIYLRGSALAVTSNQPLMNIATNEVNSNLYVFTYRAAGSPTLNFALYMHKTDMATNPTNFDAVSQPAISAAATASYVAGTAQSLSAVVANDGKVYVFFARVLTTQPSYGRVYVSIYDPVANTWTANPPTITSDSNINNVHAYYDTQGDRFHLFYQKYDTLAAYYASFVSSELSVTTPTLKAGETITQGVATSSLKTGYYNRGMQAPVCLIRDQSNMEVFYVRGSSGWRAVTPPTDVNAVQFKMLSAHNNKDNQLDMGAFNDTSFLFGRFAAFANLPPDTNSGAPTAAYVLEMRRYLNARQTELGLPVTAWAHPIAAGTAVKEADLTEIMTAITALAGTIGNTADYTLSNPWSQLYLNIDATSN